MVLLSPHSSALRLVRVFETSADLWMNMQVAHDLSKVAIAEKAELAAIEPIAVPG